MNRMRAFHNCPGGCGPGFSLVEAAIATVLIAGLFVAAISTVAASRTGQGENLDRARAHALAHDLISEIFAQPYDAPGAPSLTEAASASPSTRENFDTVRHYNGWSASPPVSRDGEPLMDDARFTRSVAIAHADPAEPDTDAGSATGALRITVTVARDDRPLAELTAIRTSAGPHHRHHHRDMHQP